MMTMTDNQQRWTKILDSSQYRTTPRTATIFRILDRRIKFHAVDSTNDRTDNTLSVNDASV